MLEYQGKYASCKVFVDKIEEAAVQQIYQFLNCPAFEGSKIRIMPDVHAGAGAVVGFTATLTDKVIPNVIGVDLGCGVRSVFLGSTPVDFPALDRFIRENIPSGFNVRNKIPDMGAVLRDNVTHVAEATGQDVGRVLRSLGTLGGGNHFIEVGVDQLGGRWLTVHTGSRNFGLKIANWHQARAVAAAGKVGKGHGLEWLEGADKDLYLEHMKVAQYFANRNRMLITQEICDFLGRDPDRCLPSESVHNYIDFDDGIIRKGAISAAERERVVIPWNMRDGLILGWGKGNADWNSSAPHGAGRVMGRGAAKRTLTVAAFEESMQGIWSSSVGADTIDESPMVYKPTDEIRAAIEDTVHVVCTVKPVYNFKASEAPR